MGTEKNQKWGTKNYSGPSHHWLPSQTTGTKFGISLMCTVPGSSGASACVSARVIGRARSFVDLGLWPKKCRQQTAKLAWQVAVKAFQ